MSKAGKLGILCVLVAIVYSSACVATATNYHEWVPFVNATLLIAVLVGMAAIWYKSNGWTAPAMKASIDQLYLFNGSLKKQTTDLKIAYTALKIEVDKQLNEAHAQQQWFGGRIIEMDERLHNQMNTLEQIKTIVEGLACAQKLKDDATIEELSYRCIHFPHLDCPHVSPSKAVVETIEPKGE